MKQPIRQQLLRPLLAVLVTAVLCLAASSAWLNWSRQGALLRQRQDEVVRVLEEATFPLTASVLQQMARLSGQQFVVWDAQAARVVESSLPGDSPDLARRIAPAMTSMTADPAVLLEWAGDNYSLRASRLSRQPGWQVLVLTSQRSLAAARWEAVGPPLAVGGVALLVLVPWLLALTRNWSRRIERIQQTVADIADGDLTVAAKTGDRDDELSALVRDIHRMSQRLQALQTELLQSERERLVAQLAAGFAHQFRNGVAGASLALQLHTSRCGTPSERSLAVAQKQLGLLETEIRGMLSLAKREVAAREPLSVAALIEDAVGLVMPAVEHHQIRLHHEAGDPDMQVTGSRDGLRAALLNLLQNAIDACGPGGEIRVQTESRDAGVTIVVRDNGPGPKPEIAARMTKAFVTTKPEGVGLGLTIVAAVAHDHGGRLSWRRETDWTAVELWLPVSP